MDRRLVDEVPGARWDVGLTVALGLAAAALVAVQAWLLASVIAGVFLGGEGLAEALPRLAALAGVAVARAALAWGHEVTAQRAAGRVKLELRARLAAQMLALGPGWVRGERSGELAHTITEGVEALDAWVARYLPQRALAAGVPLILLVAVVTADPLAALLMALTLPLIPLFMVLIGKAAKEMTRRRWLELSAMSAHLLDTLQGLPTLKLFGRSAGRIAEVAAVAGRFRESTMAVLRVAFLSALVLELVATLSVALVAVGVGLRLLYGRLGFEEALFVLVLAPAVYQPLRQLGESFHAGIEGSEAARRIAELLATRPAVAVAASAPWSLSPPGLSPAGPPAVRFAAVRFVYPDAAGASAAGGRPALDGFDLELAAGRTTALVGPSGGGKSTAVHLLLRFAEPAAGRIVVDGAPLAGLDPGAWRRRLAWVPQRPHLFHGSVADNVRLGRPGATDAAVEEAARRAEAHGFIAELPRGYETPLGERGARLSGGQAQRLALARAFLRDAPLVVLDEPTANLDADSEERLRRALARLLAGRTALVVAHRLHTVRSADVIAVVAGGRVVETGSDAELLAAGGLYPRLVGAYAGEAG